MKKIFNSPEIEIIFLGVQDDIITTSDGSEEGQKSFEDQNFDDTEGW